MTREQRLEEALRDMINLVHAMADDDAWIAERHDVEERVGKARLALSSTDSGGWLPIESAPHDGTVVLITDGETIEAAKNLGFGWQSQDGLDFGYGAWDDKLTHWAHSPELPKGRNQ